MPGRHYCCLSACAKPSQAHSFTPQCLVCKGPAGAQTPALSSHKAFKLLLENLDSQLFPLCSTSANAVGAVGKGPPRGPASGKQVLDLRRNYRP